MSLIKFFANFLRFNKKNWQAVLFCVLAATSFWFLNALNKVYTASISFPLEFIYDTKSYIPVKPLPASIQINVTGMGWDLFRRSLGLKVPPLTIPLEKPAEVKKIVGSNLPVLFAEQLEALRINFVVHDTVYLDIRERIGDWRTLMVDSLGHYLKENYGLRDSIIIKPDSIFIEGPINIVQSLSNPYPLTLEDFEIDDPYNEEVNISVPSLVKAIPEVVRVQFNVERYRQIHDTLTIEIINRPTLGNKELTVAPASVYVSYQMLESYTKTFQPDSIKATINLKGLRRGEYKILPKLNGVPGHVEILAIDSVYVTF